MAVVVPSSSSDQIPPPHSSSNTPTQSNPLPQSSHLQGDSNHEAVDAHERKPELMESFQSQEPSVFEDRSLKEAEFDLDATKVNATTGRDVTPGDGVSVLEASVGFSSSHAGLSVSNASDCETLFNQMHLCVFQHMNKLVSSNEGLSAEKQKLETRVRELEVTNKKLGEDLRHATSDLTLLKANMQKDLDLASKSLDDLSIQLESLKMSESLLRVQVENLGTEKSVLVSQVENLEAEKYDLVSEVEKLKSEKSLLTTLAEEKLSLQGKVSSLETTVVAEKVDLVQRLTDKLGPCQEDLDPDCIEKYKKYEADYVRRIKAKYFSKKNLYGGNIFENETTIENEAIKSSRWPSTRSYTDPVQSFEDHSRSSSTSAAETSANLSSRKYQSKKSSS